LQTIRQPHQAASWADGAEDLIKGRPYTPSHRHLSWFTIHCMAIKDTSIKERRRHIKTEGALVFIHTGKNSKRLHLGFRMTEAQERRLYEMLRKRYGK